jgi:hypothetical protein
MARIKSRPKKFTKKGGKTRSFKKRVSMKRGRTTRRVGRKRPVNMAHVTETLDLGEIPVNTLMNHFVAGRNASLAVNLTAPGPIILTDFERFNSHAQQYRYFRINKVTYRYIPNANLYTSGAASTTNAMPIRYTHIDRSGLFAYQSLADMQDAGIKGHPWTKVFAMTYKPSGIRPGATFLTEGSSGQVGIGTVLSPAGTAPGLSDLQWEPDFSKWYVTQNQAKNNQFPNVGLYGHQMYFNMDATPVVGTHWGRWEVTINASFKEPSVTGADTIPTG